MVINLFFFIYSIIIIFGKGEGGRGLIFEGDIVCRIRGLTFGGGAYFRGGGLIFGGLRYGYIWVLFLKNLLSEGVSCKVRFFPFGPHHGGGGASSRYYIILHQKPNTQPSALNYKLIPCPQKIVVARLLCSFCFGLERFKR